MDRIIDRISHGADNGNPKIRTRRSSLEDLPHWVLEHKDCEFLSALWENTMV